MEQRVITITVRNPEAERAREEAEQRMLRRADRWCAACAWLVVLIAAGFILAGVIHERANLQEQSAESRAEPPCAYVIGSLCEGRLPGDDIPATEYAVLPPVAESRYAEVTEEDQELLARLVWLEARGEPEDGKQAVAEVVLNRVAAENFPGTVSEVVYQGLGTSKQQFTPAGRIDEATPTDAEYAAVEQAIHGESILPLDVVYFSTAGENDRVWGQIGNHVFCYQYIWE